MVPHHVSYCALKAFVVVSAPRHSHTAFVSEYGSTQGMVRFECGVDWHPQPCKHDGNEATICQQPPRLRIPMGTYPPVLVPAMYLK